MSFLYDSFLIIPVVESPTGGRAVAVLSFFSPSPTAASFPPRHHQAFWRWTRKWTPPGPPGPLSVILRDDGRKRRHRNCFFDRSPPFLGFFFFWVTFWQLPTFFYMEGRSKRPNPSPPARLQGGCSSRAHPPRSLWTLNTQNYSFSWHVRS